MQDRIGHFECDDITTVDFLSFEVSVHAVAKPLVDPYGVPDLKDPDELYFVYVCTKNPLKSKQKDDKKNRILVQKEGKKALAKKLKELRQKQQQNGHLAKTPMRDEFGNARTDDHVVHHEVDENANGPMDNGEEKGEEEGEDGEKLAIEIGGLPPEAGGAGGSPTKGAAP